MMFRLRLAGLFGGLCGREPLKNKRHIKALQWPACASIVQSVSIHFDRRHWPLAGLLLASSSRPNKHVFVPFALPRSARRVFLHGESQVGSQHFLDKAMIIKYMLEPDRQQPVPLTSGQRLPSNVTDSSSSSASECEAVMLISQRAGAKGGRVLVRARI